jgi:hypothetical protein
MEARPPLHEDDAMSRDQIAQGIQPEAASVMHTYEAKDGTVYTGTEADILTACPAFNKLPPELGKVVLKSYLLGRQEMAKAEQAEKPEESRHKKFEWSQSKADVADKGKTVPAEKVQDNSARVSGFAETRAVTAELRPVRPETSSPVQVSEIIRKITEAPPEQSNPFMPEAAMEYLKPPLSNPSAAPAEKASPKHLDPPADVAIYKPAVYARESSNPEPAVVQQPEKIFEKETFSQDAQDYEAPAVREPESLEQAAAREAPLQLPEPMPEYAWQEIAEPADLSAEVDALLKELQAPPAPGEESGVVPVSAERSEFTDEEVIQSFTEALLSAPDAAEDVNEPELVETPEPPGIVQEVAVKIEQIEPQQKQAAAETMLAIAETLEAIHELPASGGNEARIQATQELEELCERLFEAVGMDPGKHKQAVRSFARAMLKLDPKAFRRSAFAEAIDEGTHERKKGWLGLLAPVVRALQSDSAHPAIGVVALRGAVNGAA